MILVNTDYISGKELEMLGLVKGSTIQSKHIGKDISQSFKTLVGGELKSYNEMMNEARALATKRMVAEAEALGADAIVNIRYASSAIMVLYYIAYFGFLIALIDGIWKWLLGIIPLALSAVMLKVCIERINEIKKGEEDDLSKY